MGKGKWLSVCFQSSLRIATQDVPTPAGFLTQLPPLDDRHQSLSMSSVSVPESVPVLLLYTSDIKKISKCDEEPSHTIMSVTLRLSFSQTLHQWLFQSSLRLWLREPRYSSSALHRPILKSLDTGTNYLVLIFILSLWHALRSAVQEDDAVQSPNCFNTLHSLG